MYSAVRSRVLTYALLSMISIAPKMLYADSKPSAADAGTTTDNIVILQVTDPEPASAVRIQTIKVGNDMPAAGVAYSRLLASAKEMAKRSDANIIKINKVNVYNGSSACDEMVATLYKASDPKIYEKEFAWDPSRRLTWEDFRGPVQSYTVENIAAATYCSIGFETIKAPGNGQVRVNVFNSFYPTKSWARDVEKNVHVLAHEQCHFDICELYTRKLRERMAGIPVDFSTLDKLKAIYRQVQKEYETRQEALENETDHGLIYAEQDRWQKSIANELQAADSWKQS